MNRYEVEMKKGKTSYIAILYGETIDMAVEHANYWYDDGEKIGPDYTIEKVMNVTPCFGDPYTYENAVRKALADPMRAIHAILQQDNVSESDKLDLIKRTVNGSSAGFQHMDTAERDYLVDIMEGVD